MTLSAGQILNNRYRIVELLGQGGFGAVYQAWDSNLDAPVAIKECLEISPKAQRQFKIEAQLLFKLHHANLPRVHDHFIIPGEGQYLVMDFVEGQDLGVMLLNGPLPEARVLPWIIQVCDALCYLHAQNPPVIHRDIKPGNIRITPEGKAMLVDFGLSKVYDPTLATSVGARGFTPGYSPPEQYGKGGTDVRSDLYALGATLYHLLTGQVPPDSVDIMSRVAKPPPPVVDIKKTITDAVSAAIVKAMALDREDRWESVRAFKQAITTKPASASRKETTAILDTEVIPPPPRTPTVPYQGSTEKTKPKTLWIWLGVAGALGIVGVLCVYGVISVITGGGTETPISIVTTEVVDMLPSDTLPPPSTITQPLSTPITEIPPISTTETPSISVTPVVDLIDSHGVPMKMIPAGEFQMGGDADDTVQECEKLCPSCSCERSNYEDEEPAHTVDLDAFYMDLTEVTNAMYISCVNKGACTEPSSKKSYTREAYYGNSTYDDYPVVYVSWEQARGYCEWRGARLPSEAEWEKAARGGFEGKLYPWGDESPVCRKGTANGAKFDDNSGCNETDTEPVGSYAPNGYGLFDMAGNVWEWVMDWYSESYYASLPSQNPTGPSSGDSRVLRGGSWYLNGGSLRVANRHRDDPPDTNYGLGFRCARSP